MEVVHTWQALLLDASGERGEPQRQTPAARRRHALQIAAQLIAIIGLS
jgi:hypothetical protein